MSPSPPQSEGTTRPGGILIAFVTAAVVFGAGQAIVSYRSQPPKVTAQSLAPALPPPPPQPVVPPRPVAAASALIPDNDDAALEDADAAAVQPSAAPAAAVPAPTTAAAAPSAGAAAALAPARPPPSPAAAAPVAAPDTKPASATAAPAAAAPRTAPPAAAASPVVAAGPRAAPAEAEPHAEEPSKPEPTAEPVAAGDRKASDHDKADKSDKSPEKDIAREAWRKNLPDIAVDETRAAILIPIKGSIEGATYHVVKKPRSVVVNLPKAESMITMRFYGIKHDGFRNLWIKQDETDGTTLKLVLGPGTTPQVEIKDDYVRITIRKPSDTD